MVNKELELLKNKIEETCHANESQIHKDLKYWIAKKYLESGISFNDIEFEYKLAESSHVFTIPDVYIKQFGNIAVYCERELDWQWLWTFLDKNLPILKQFTSKQVIVFPVNVSALHPHRSISKEYYKELRDRDIEIIFSPIKLDIQKMITLEISSEAFNILNELKKEYDKDSNMSEFIVNDLKNIINPGMIV